MTCVLITRPLEDALPMADALRSKGLESVLYPLFEPLFLPVPYLKTPQALIITSKNALRAIEGEEDLKNIPLYGVGDETARLAQCMGFKNVISASGTSHDLIDLILKQTPKEQGILYHLSGNVIKVDIVKELQKKGLTAKRKIVYRIQKIRNLQDSLLYDLENKKISHVMFFSPRTARFFVSLLNENKLEKIASEIRAVCLSNSVAQAVRSLQWKEIWISPQPLVKNMIGYFHEEK